MTESGFGNPDLLSQQSLPKDEIHVWVASLTQPASVLSELTQTLSSEELYRSGQYYFQRDKDWFAARRGILRLLLSKYRAALPHQICFQYARQGKPELSHTNDTVLQFNLSSSHGKAIYAFVIDRRIGIDIEYSQSFPDIEQIAHDCLSPRELAIFLNLSPEARLNWFLRCWTGKEAALKASGDGLTKSLRQVEVLPGSANRMKFATLDGETTQTSRWSICELMLEPDYVGSLVVEGSPVPIKMRSWSHPELWR